MVVVVVGGLVGGWVGEGGWGEGGRRGRVVVVAVVVVRTVQSQRVSGDTLACVHLIKWASVSALAPSAGLSSRKKPIRVIPYEGRFQPCPGTKPHPTPSRGKRLRGSPTSPPTPSEEGGRNLFHLLKVWMPQVRVRNTL